MLQKLRSLLWPTCYRWRKLPFASIVDMAMQLLFVCFPAINVLVVGYFGNALVNGDNLFFPILLLIVLFGTRTFVLQLMVCAAISVGMYIEKYINADFFNRTSKISSRNYNDQEFINRMTLAQSALEGNLFTTQSQAVDAFITGAISGLTLCYTLWDHNQIVACLSLILPIPLIINNMGYGHAHKKFYPPMARENKRCQYFYDQLDRDRSGFDLATLNGRGTFTTISNKFRQNWYKLGVQLQKTALYYTTTSGAFAVVIYAISIYLLLKQGDTVSLLAGIMGLTAALNTLVLVGFQIGKLGETFLPNQQLYDFLYSEPHNDTLIQVDGSKELAINNVVVNYGDKQAVKDVSITLKPHQLTALVGTNGSGKTSLLKAIMSSQQQASGSVTNGENTLDINDYSSTLDYAVINQEFQKFDISIREFLLLGIKHDVTEEEIWEALAKVEFADYVRNLEQGLDTETGVQWGGVDLSGGQWQRLCIARGLLAKKGLLILDEPTSAIDAPTEERIFDYLAQEAQQRLVLLTSHRVSTLKAAGMIYVMEDGVIVESGSYRDLNQPGTKFRAIFESQYITQSQEQGAEQTGEQTSEQVAPQVTS